MFFMFKKAALGISSLAITAFVGLGMATEASAHRVTTGENIYILQRKKWAMAKTHLLK